MPEPWDALCEDGQCEDPIHPTHDQLIQRLTDANASFATLDTVQDIIEAEYTKYIKERSQP